MLERKILFIGVLLFINGLNAQQGNSSLKKIKKHRFYFYWGWNTSWYSNSDIHFKGNDAYDFTLYQVRAQDRQSNFGINPYFHPTRLTIPQYNFRIGYYLTNHLDISLGIDHMKYVVQQGQNVKINGIIRNSSTYNGTYNHDNIPITKDFLQFEHTDGLNYINIELRRHYPFYRIFNNKLQFDCIAGGGLGILYPKTNTTLFNQNNHDAFHFSGYGIGGVTGVKMLLFDYFFVQSEYKIGFIHMPWIRISSDSSESASQHFFFTQLNMVFGSIIAF